MTCPMEFNGTTSCLEAIWSTVGIGLFGFLIILPFLLPYLFLLPLLFPEETDTIENEKEVQ